MFGNIQAQQEAMAAKLKAIEITSVSDDSLISVKVNGQKELLDLTINESKWESKDIEELQDKIVITLNDAFAKADVKAEEVTSKALSELLPPGMGGLDSLFGG